MSTEIDYCLEKILGLDSTDEEQNACILQKNALIPDYLYKYRSLTNNALNNLRTQTLWFDKPANMNDPYDCRFTVQNLLDQKCSVEFYKHLFEDQIDVNIINRLKNESISLRKLIETEPGMMEQALIPTLIKAIDEISEQDHLKFLNKLLNEVHFCSLSSSYDSMLMWTHYCNEHRGFCIEYDLNNLEKAKNFKGLLYPVKYSEDLFDITPAMPTSTEISHGIKEMKNGGPLQTKDTKLFMLNPLLHKNINWSYEKEWRAIYPFGILKESQSMQSPKPSAILLGSNFFNQFDIYERSRDTIYFGTLSLAFDLLSLCKKNDLEIRFMKNDIKKFRMIYDVMTYDECKQKLIKLKNAE
ncbi:DUF2971 domain-containing protein [Acinetobacter gerneri]|uniref:DUF2971 domain-containing protein n=1 Tax=Acinetobacter gerneri TaxID=202952 RepID=A0AAW8JK72_9GAMM|nr:DUF2971 domain-containing protein [Acinetobacter gerneri]MDQ9010552.1 DUF2971 domain-containing protein [Acinetobacter gerneri]MDQ9014751.1 DUF2971 domain-containing protein [Acinetobacter gerneri]MDQ9025911.1 DUF2971 domain-containing protein [Acinetobacter gerneri]MDQ9053203.1 DUF2971 domain-containing protein [Acinetobacter gerneri]MDQ9060810.1 DUF2971 domain-containing protein [Acinetobacter gerneri]